jgi:predicted nucleic-acid-binding protein
VSRKTIDAGVLLHFVAADHPRRSPRCRALFERVRNGDETVYLPEAALADAVRALSTVQRWPAGRVAAFAGDLLALDGVLMQRKDLVRNALSLFKDEGLDFQAALIAAETSAMGIEEMLSYDRDLGRVAGVARVEP